MNRLLLSTRLLICLLLLVPALAAAQGYPNRVIRLVVAYAPGGATDAFARPVAQSFSRIIGQSVIVENRAGGNSIIGTDHVAKAAPDGYTLLVTPASHTLIPFYNKNVPYDAVKDFTPIIAAGVNRRSIIVHPSLPVKSIQELIAYAKRNPGKISYAVAAAGSVQELAGDLLRVTTGIEIVPVPYKGGGPALQDLLGGQVQMAILVLADTLPHIKSGRLRALGIVESKRAKVAPEIPTVAEAGVPGFNIPDQWVGVLGPAGLPPEIVAKLNADFNKALNTPETRTALENIGYEVTGGSAQDHAALIANDMVTYRKYAKEIGITPK
jgi:tripartite-type tricarboxylate transporter receptor subunit TctC